MAETKVLPIKAEDASLEAIGTSSPSFKGRLNLRDYAFEAPRTQQTLRRSPRSLTPKVESSNYPSLATIIKAESSSSPSPSSPAPTRKRGTDTPSSTSSSSSSPNKKPRVPAGYAP
ncbi:hypothetical protein V491_02890, partial [Pseudogymnoascus sp. VKM F-3775]